MLDRTERPPPSKVFQGTVVLGFGQMASYGLSFARNVILARLLTKSDFGMASTFAMVVTLFEFASRVAIGLQIVQNKDGDAPHFQGASQLFQFLLGILSAVMILCFSNLFAQAFHVPQTAWAFACLAIIPLSKGFEHLDVSRKTRNLNYRATVLVDAVPQLLITILAWPLAAWLKDFRALLVLLIAKALMSLALSHVLAERKYHWAGDRATFKTIINFGWPLLLNGFLTFAILQGDQFVVGSCYSMADLAGYFVASTVTLIPGIVIVQVAGSIILPVLAKVQEDKVEFMRTYRLCLESLTLLSTLVSLALITCGGMVITLVYGNKYHSLGMIVACLALANCFRVIRAVPSMAAMAIADTKNQLIQNIFRSVGVALALLAAHRGSRLEAIAACGFAGECLAFLVSIYRFSTREKVAMKESFRPVGITTMIVGAALGAQMFLGSHKFYMVICAIFLSCVTTVAMREPFNILLGEVKNMLAHFVPGIDRIYAQRQFQKSGTD